MRGTSFGICPYVILFIHSSTLRLVALTDEIYLYTYLKSMPFNSAQFSSSSVSVFIIMFLSTRRPISSSSDASSQSETTYRMLLSANFPEDRCSMVLGTIHSFEYLKDCAFYSVLRATCIVMGVMYLIFPITHLSASYASSYYAMLASLPSSQRPTVSMIYF